MSSDISKKTGEIKTSENQKNEAITRSKALKKIGIGIAASTTMLLLLQSKAKAQGSVYPDPFSNF